MSWMVYGATGYTGRLIACEAAQRGLRPVLAGRDPQALRDLAESLELPWRAFDLTDPERIRDALRGLRAVLHCAGPFSVTSGPMLDACLAERVHYLDITGEISVFEHAHSLQEAAQRADVVLLPGAGFDVVPSDCLAASLVEALPAATRLELAIYMSGGVSPGTAKTVLEGIGQGGLVRRDGRLERVPLASKSRSIPFPSGERRAVRMPWGDVFTAYVSTGVPDIEVYMVVPRATVSWLRRLRWLLPALDFQPLRAIMKTRIERTVSGPSEQARKDSGGELWGRATSADGRSVAATMTTPNGYDLTVTASLAIVSHLLENPVEGGFYTPSLLMGSGFAGTLPGVSFSRVS